MDGKTYDKSINYIPEKRKFSGILCFRQQPPPYGSEMARNAIESEFRTSKMADQSEMARNAIQSDFQTSKMAAGTKKNLYRSEMARIAIESEFRKSQKWPIDLKWPEMRK